MANITDAQDSLDTTPRPSTPASINSIDDVPAFQKVDNQPRTNQQQVIPTAIKTRLLANLFSNNPDGTALGSAIKLRASVPTGFTVTFIFNLSNPDGRELIAVPDVAFYFSNPTSNNQWPTGTLNMGNMPASVFNDWGLTDNKNVVTRATMYNNSGATQLIYCYCRFRIIAFPGTTTVSNKA